VSKSDRNIEGSLFVHGNIYLTGEINKGELSAASNTRKAVNAVTQVLALNPANGSSVVGTATPATVTMLEPQGFYDSIRLKWTVQSDLRWLSHYEIQVSSDNAAWYSLCDDGSDWKGTLNAVTSVNEATYRHDNIPFAGTAGNPTAVTLYYRVRQVTIAGTIGAWSSSSSGMASPIQGEDKIAAGSIVGGNIAATTITGDNIAANTITGEKVVADVALLDKVFSNDIVVPDGGTQRWFEEKGIRRRCIELKDGIQKFLDSPDTTPASAETLRALFGRIGPGPDVIMDGSFQANITSPWGSEVPINSAISSDPAFIQLADGTKRVVYVRASDGYICERIDSGSGWGAELPRLVNLAKDYNNPAYIQTADGTLRMCFNSGTTSLLESVWSGSAWGAATGIAAGYVKCRSPTYVQSSSGRLFIMGYYSATLNWIELIGSTWTFLGSLIGSVTQGEATSASWGTDEAIIIYRQYSTGYLVHRILNLDTGTLGSEITITTVAAISPSCIRMINGEFRVTYCRVSDNYVCQRIWSGSAWGSETELNSAASASPCYLQESSGNLRLAYIRTADNYLIERTLRRYAQVGAGIIEEGGDDATGYWEMSGNDKLEQWGIQALASASFVGSSWSNAPFYQLVTVTFQKPFLTPPIDIKVNTKRSTGGGFSWVGYILSASTTGFSVYVYNSLATDDGVYITWSARGKRA